VKYELNKLFQKQYEENLEFIESKGKKDRNTELTKMKDLIKTQQPEREKLLKKIENEKDFVSYEWFFMDLWYHLENHRNLLKQFYNEKYDPIEKVLNFIEKIEHNILLFRQMILKIEVNKKEFLKFDPEFRNITESDIDNEKKYIQSKMSTTKEKEKENEEIIKSINTFEEFKNYLQKKKKTENIWFHTFHLSFYVEKKDILKIQKFSNFLLNLSRDYLSKLTSVRELILKKIITLIKERDSTTLETYIDEVRYYLGLYHFNKRYFHTRTV
jgi:hypothetical protein